MNDIMNDFDNELYANRYCNKENCKECDGVDYNGEPNGYGCSDQDDYINKWYQSILKRRYKKLKRNK